MPTPSPCQTTSMTRAGWASLVPKAATSTSVRGMPQSSSDAATRTPAATMTATVPRATSVSPPSRPTATPTYPPRAAMMPAGLASGGRAGTTSRPSWAAAPATPAARAARRTTSSPPSCRPDDDRLPFLPSPATTTTASTPPASSSTSSPSGGSSGLSSGAIAGIAIGAAAGIAILAVIIWACFRRARKSREEGHTEQHTFSPEMGSQSPPFDKTRQSHLSYATTAIPPSYGSTPGSQEGQFQDAHHMHSPTSMSRTYSPYTQHKDVEHTHSRHISVVSGVSALSGGIESNLHTVSEIDGIERQAPVVELPADEAPPNAQVSSSPSPPLGSPGWHSSTGVEAPGSPGRWTTR
ncbi:hypothetical protein BN1723_000884 [Verticillium longisporum]|uniref:Mid2 domain-containing protein n=2 Tax=Verticillium longisporum TaxID=100787 RepID=A0A0G4NCN5_VERLO|nr:hypothetical protein BN1723_000884 [Verticillium longisporum]